MDVLPPIPGPAGALLGSGSTSAVSLASAERQGDAEAGVECEVVVLRACGFFLQRSWRALCAALDVDGQQDQNIELLCPIARIQQGDWDFVVPQTAGIIERIHQVDDEDAIAVLVDPSGRMEAYFHVQAKQEFGDAIAVGATVLLQQVAIYVSGPATRRYLNVHPHCIAAVFGNGVD